jgi:hypothetical protein
LRGGLAFGHPAAIWTRNGRLAQLVERLLYTQDVGGSSPSSPTNLRREAEQVARPTGPAEGRPDGKLRPKGGLVPQLRLASQPLAKAG